MTSLLRRLVPVAAVAALSMGVASTARADGDEATALQLFDEGRALAQDGNVPAACDKFQASYALAKKLGTLLNLADCNEKLGRTASAWALYTEAATIAAREGQGERQAFARARIDALVPRLSHVTVRVASPPPGLEVKRDEAVVPPAAFGTNLPIDPGDHVFSATAPHKRRFETRVHVEEQAATATVTIGPLDDAPPETDSPGEEAHHEEPRRPLRTVGAAVIGVGVVGIGVGAVLGLTALNKQGSSGCTSNHCPNEDDAQKLRAALTDARLSTVFFVGGAVVAAAGVALFVLAPKAGRTSVTAVVGPGRVGMRAAF